MPWVLVRTTAWWVASVGLSGQGAMRLQASTDSEAGGPLLAVDCAWRHRNRPTLIEDDLAAALSGLDCFFQVSSVVQSCRLMGDP